MKVITYNSSLKYFTSILADLNIFILHLWIVYNVYILTLTTLHRNRAYLSKRSLLTRR